jgi:DNA-binding NarL/FixJ family response regulator
MEVELPTAADDGRRADVVIADYTRGLECAADGSKRLGGAVVLVTASNREQEIRRALEAGIQGYVLLGCDMNELAEAVRVVGYGSKYLCLQAAQRMAESLTREALTPREMDVLRLLSVGSCNKWIARDLDIAVCTVKVHVKAIMAKLGARSRTHAVAVAAHRGLVSEVHPISRPWMGARQWPEPSNAHRLHLQGALK